MTTTLRKEGSQISVRVDSSLRRKLEQAAEQDRRSISAWARLRFIDALADSERQVAPPERQVTG
jgi:predicted transcriptional regulator